MTEQYGGRLDEKVESMVFRGLCSEIDLLCDLDFGKRRRIGECTWKGIGSMSLPETHAMKSFQKMDCERLSKK